MHTTNTLDATKSFAAHHAGYETEFGIDWCRKHYADYEARNLFSIQGFEKHVLEAKQTLSTHIDIGSGAGWLVRKTAPHFATVYAVEPSLAATEIAKELNTDLSNIQFMNMGMFEFMTKHQPQEPYLTTTATVLSHIDNATVKNFLKILNDAPIGSRLYFGEPFDRNRYQYLWFIRSREWWAAQLTNWQLEFSDCMNDSYPYGIAGVAVGKANVTNRYRMSITEKIVWLVSGIPSYLKYLGRIVLRKT